MGKVRRKKDKEKFASSLFVGRVNRSLVFRGKRGQRPSKVHRLAVEGKNREEVQFFCPYSSIIVFREERTVI